MDTEIRCWINITMESVILLVLVILLFTCFVQKKRFSTTKPLIVLTSVNILLLIVQIVEWVLLLQNVAITHGLTATRIAYALDYALYYAVAAAFFYYIHAHITDLYQDKGVTYTQNVWQKRIVIAWGIVISFIFTLAVFSEKFYYIENGAETFNRLAYLIMFLVGTFAVINSVITIIRHRKILGARERILLVAYVAVPNLLYIFDLLYGFSFDYVLMSLFIFILYIHIDIRRGTIIDANDVSLSELSTQIMLSQMQPHFLYNVLTNISGLCYIENALEAKSVVDHFSEYLRANLDSMGKDKFIPFEKELEHVKTYLWLEKVRFGDAITVRYVIESTDFIVPSLAIQPLVENAIKHGIRRKEGGGTVTIKTYETQLEHIVIIEDDGVGFNVGEVPNDNRSHVGIKNVKERLQILCNGSCDIQSEKGKGTVVTVHIPKK